MKIFIDFNTLSDVSISKLRLWICKFIRSADSTAFPKAHDLRKVASSFAFFRSMNVREMCSVTGWSSIRVFRRHYLRQIEEVSSSLIVLGSIAKGSVSRN